MKKPQLIIGIIIFLLLSAGCQEQIDPRNIQRIRPPPDPDSPLIGTLWSGGGRGVGGAGASLYFKSAETVIFNEGTAEERPLGYYYVKETRSGHVYSLGNFTVSSENTMVFSTWRGFPCGADFTRTNF